MKKLFALFLVFAISLIGCATPVTHTIDPDTIQDLGIPRFTPQEIDKSVQKWLDSMVNNFEPIASSTGRPVVLFGMPQNRTNEHVDMDEFQAAFEIYGTKTGKIKFSSVKQLGDQILEQMKCQQSDLVNPDTAVKFGKMKGWKYSLYVTLFAPTEEMIGNGGVKYRYYRAVLKLVNNEDGTLEWSEEKKFLKETAQKRVGW